MIEDFYFLDEGQVKITAATVGISKQRWAFINENEISSKRHIELMTKNKFDHLPIIGSDGTITEFFKTSEPNNYKKIVKETIDYNDVIPLDTKIKDVIDKFASEDRTFYFLSYQRNITGLITIGNLNCKQIQIYVFSIVCELERGLGDFLNHCLSNLEIKNWAESKKDRNNPEDKYHKMLKSHHDLSELDLENQFTEHFFLVDFFNIITEKKLYNYLSFSKGKWKELSSINEIRKRIAHPTRSLLDKDNNIIKLKERINKIEDLSFRLNNYNKTADKNGYS